jgi:hypothetical protein
VPTQFPFQRRVHSYDFALPWILRLFVFLTLSACAGSRSADLHPRYGGGMVPGTFDFTEGEWFAALRLVLPDSAARRRAAEFSRPDEKLDNAINLDGLALLSLATESGSVKAERIRQEWRAAVYRIWLDDERQRRGVSETDLARRWAVRTAREDRIWEARRDHLRQSLQRKGRLASGG